MNKTEDKRKCDLCDLDAVWYASPTGNPDEPALCQDHFDDYKVRMLGLLLWRHPKVAEEALNGLHHGMQSWQS